MGRFIKIFGPLRALLWKNYLVKLRSPLTLLLEIVSPTLFALMMYWMTYTQPSQYSPTCNFKPKALPTASGVLALQSYFCAANNTCEDSSKASFDAFKPSLLANLGEALKNSFNLKSNRKRDIEVDLANLAKDMYTIDTVAEAIENQNAKWRLLYNSLLRSNIYSETNESENYHIKKLMRVKRNIYSTGVTNSILRLIMQEVVSSSPEMNLVNSFLCGPEMSDIEDQFSQFLTVDFSAVGNFKYKKDDDLSDSCNSALESLEMIGYKEMLHYLKPLMFGKVVYTPDAPVINRIMNRLNESFTKIKKLLDLMKVATRAWGELKSWSLSDAIDKYKNEENFLREAVQTKLGKGILKYFGSERIGASGEENMQQKINTFRQLLEDTRSNYMTYMKEVPGPPISYYAEILECLDLDKVVGVSDETDALEKAKNYLSARKLWGFVVFSNVPAGADELPSSVTYKLRIPSSRAPNTNYKRNVNSTEVKMGPIKNLKEITGGTVHLQNLIEGELINEYTGNNKVPGIYLQQMPYPCFKKKAQVSGIFVNCLLLSWIYFFSQLVKQIAVEKEMLFKDVLRVFGVKPFHHWIAFFIPAFTIGVIASVLSCMVYSVIFGSFFLIFIFHVGFLISCICLAFLISTFFSKASFCAVLSSLLYLLLFMVYTVFEGVESPAAMIFLCLISNVAGGFGAGCISNMQASNVEVSMNNINHSPDFGSPLTILVIIIMFLIDSVIYVLLAIYFENVLAKGAGRKPWLYCFKASYWKRCCKTEDGEETTQEAETSSTTQRKKRDSKNFEADPEGLPAGIEVINVSKEFGSGSKKIRVVNDLTLTFYEGQITSFLGHNGAGKSTTVAMMTGVIPVTKGTIRLYGVDLKKNPEEALKNIGICMQENILLADLSAKDHLTLIGKLKNLNPKELRRNLDELMDVFEFKSRGRQPVKHLSGGWKRKVCVAMAFMGGSRTIFLDEPTAGIDPFARRSIWDVLSKLKNGRTIVLITHHLDEADVLGDRIAIIASGELKCCGSSAYLKSQLDKGYTLTVDTSVRPDKTNAKKSKNSKKALSPQAQEINSVVKSAIGNAEFEEERGCEIIFSLPPRQSSSDLNRVFDALERNKKRLNITSYGVSAVSLEEVFLKVLMKIEAEENKSKEGTFESHTVERISSRKVEQMDNDRGKTPRSSKGTQFSITSRASETNNTKRKSTLVEEEMNKEVPVETVPQSPPEMLQKSFTQLSESEMRKIIAVRQKEKMRSGRKIGHHFVGLVIKRFLHIKRNYIFLLVELLAPFGLLALILWGQKANSYPEAPVDISAYKSSLLFYSTSIPGNSRLSSYEDALLGPYGMGTKCVLTPEKCTLESIPRGSLVATGATIDSNKCVCDDEGVLTCEGDATEDPPNAQMSTGHTLFNMTGLDIQNWLIATEHTYSLNRIGGIVFGHFAPLTGVSIGDFIQLFSDKKLADALKGYLQEVKKIDPAEFTSTVMAAVDKTFGEKLFKEKDPSNNMIVWFNPGAKIGAMALVNGVSNLVLRASLPQGTDPSGYSIQLIVHPLDDSECETEGDFGALALIIIFFYVFGLLFGLLIIYLVDEKACGMKHLEIIYGVNRIIYWLNNFLWDMLIFSAFVLSWVILIFVFDLKKFKNRDVLTVLVVAIYSYGIASLFYVYLWSLYFNLSSNAFIFIFIWIAILGGFPSVIIIMISLASKGGAHDTLQKIGLLLPEYCLAKCMFNLSSSLTFFDSNLFEWEHSTKYIFRMLCNAGVYLALLFLIEFRNVPPLGLIMRALASTKVLCRPSHRRPTEDDDVTAEKERVRSGKAKQEGDMLIVKNLTKIYCRQMEPAVNHIYVGIKHGECLGLLGMNGAGKTTFFNMISGRVTPTLGDASIGGYSITYRPLQSRLLVGYCPQLNSLDPYLTPVEHLSFFCTVRGLWGKRKQKEVESMLELMNLTKHKDKISKTLSGGNQRKLNAAIALLCEPELVLLDEPTAGMDVLARRFLWSRMQEILQDGRCLVLTTHSMEECQALATQVSIMYMGRFACFGSSQHLKSKFNEGYVALLRLVNVDKSKEVVNFLNENLAGSTVVQLQNVQMRVKLHPDTQIGKAISVLSEAKRKQLIEDYSVNQTSLENVFLKLIGEFDRTRAYKRTCCGF